MSESPTPAVDLLRASQAHLRNLADAAHDQLVPAADQRAAEFAVAVGVAELASEDRPEPVDELPTRPMLAKDLVITVDLVLRALEAANS